MILQVNNLTKIYGDFTAVNNISFGLERGEIVGLLGPNGAGKTTIIQMLLGVLLPTSGSIHYFGQDLSTYRTEILERVNFSSSYTNLPWDLTVKENLTFVSYLYDIPDRPKRIEEVLEDFQLLPLIKNKVTELSEGQKTRLNLAKAFLNRPEVLLLDEPTASLDPEVASKIRKKVIKEKNERNLSIIFTSHNMAEVEEVCDRIIVINKGKIIANSTAGELARRVKNTKLELLIQSDMEKTKLLLTEKTFAFSVNDKRLVIELEENYISALLSLLSLNSINYDEISIEKPNLEDYFLAISRETDETT